MATENTARAFAPDNSALAKLVGVKEPQNAVSRYVAIRLSEHMAAAKTTQVAVAKEAGVSTAQISNLLDGSRNAGARTMRGLAKVLGTTWPQLEDDAARWAATQKPKTAAPARWAELEPRYPNLAAALRQLGAQVGDRTRAALAGVALHSAVDLDVSTWQTMALDTERKLRRETKTGEPVGEALPDEDDAPPFGR